MVDLGLKSHRLRLPVAPPAGLLDLLCERSKLPLVIVGKTSVIYVVWDLEEELLELEE